MFHLPLLVVGAVVGIPLYLVYSACTNSRKQSNDKQETETVAKKTEK